LLARLKLRLQTCGVVAALFLLGCGSEPVLYFEDLPSPAFWWIHISGACGSIRAVDGARAVRVQHGCETGRQPLGQIGTMEAGARDTLLAKVIALPRAAADLASCGGSLHTFGHRDQGRDMATSVCGKTRDVSATAGLEEPFLSVATTLLSLP
jgi:hypothetical protein